jgi:hypothetical protein
MYSVIVYFSETLKKKYKSIQDITQDFQFLENPTKEGFYKDILSDDLIEIENVNGQYVVTSHMFINKINFKNLEDIYQNFQFMKKPVKEGFYREIDGNLIKITKEDI